LSIEAEELSKLNSKLGILTKIFCCENGSIFNMGFGEIDIMVTDDIRNCVLHFNCNKGQIEIFTKEYLNDIS
tara:strand:- start:355 stop:570 length:216 start_codon:yes stop_codon:yes gene_type:complete